MSSPTPIIDAVDKLLTRARARNERPTAIRMGSAMRDAFAREVRARCHMRPCYPPVPWTTYRGVRVIADGAMSAPWLQVDCTNPTERCYCATCTTRRAARTHALRRYFLRKRIDRELEASRHLFAPAML